MKHILHSVIVFLAVILWSGGITHLTMLTGRPVTKKEAKTIMFTPFATGLVALGATGLFTMFHSRRSHTRQEAWAKLVLGALMLFAGWMLMETLLIIT